MELRENTLNFLKKLSEYYEIFFFSSRRRYLIEKLINQIDKNLKEEIISHRYFSKEDCSLTENEKFIKDIYLVKDRHIKDIVFLDYKPESLAFNLSNLVLIPFWNGQKDGEILEFFTGYLINLAKVDDCRAKILKDFDYSGVTELIGMNEYVVN